MSSMSIPPVVPMSMAYWFGTEIILEDDTTVVIASDVKALVIITPKFTIGQRVTISWERPPLTPDNTPPKPRTPDGYPQADGVGSERGRDGALGGTPNTPAPMGQPAPELEIWFLDSSGFPVIDLRGQDGAQGVRGGDGGDGGPGQKGCNTQKKMGFCSQEQGPGGDGGNGGRAGDGGRGGDGGIGGIFAVFAPQPLINAWLQTGLTVSVEGGSPGAGGDSGRPGEGGPGGDKGDKVHSVCRPNNRQSGQRGRTGASGNRGPDGKPGILQSNSIRYSAITTSDFNIETAKPAVVSVSPRSAFVGDTISVNGLRFSVGDVVFIEGIDGQINVPCATTFVADSLLTFKVPTVPGGYAFVEVQQVDGTRSSSHGTLTIQPRIESIIPSGRIRPGEFYFLKGTGLGRTGTIWINGEGASTFETVDAVTVKFKASRPFNIQDNPINESGEPARLKVVNAEGSGVGNPNHSSEINVVLDTYRILAFGDSVMWGGGLPEHQKFYSLAADYMRSQLERIGVYKTVKAHHGAKIGLGNSIVKDELPGELSTRYPTILQQVESLSTIPDAAEVDLILVDGGANDLPITNFMLQTTPSELAARKQDLIDKSKQYCFVDMTTLLKKIAGQFPKAKIIVTGYYHIWSSESSPSSVVSFILGLTDGEVLPPDPADVTSLKLTTLCNAWVLNSNKDLSDAVTQLNAILPGDVRIFFVNPETVPKNAAFAPEPFLWEPDALGGPRDPVYESVRKQQREDNRDRLKDEDSSLSWPLPNNMYKMSKGNSSFHPNPAGAFRYFEKMRPVLDLAAKAKRIAIRSSSGHYLCAEGGGNGALAADRTAIGPWETFEMIDLGNSQIALRSVSGQYVCAEGGGANGVVVNRARRGSWETFTLIPQGTGTGSFALRTSNNVNYLSATGGGGSGVTAIAKNVGSAEVFRVF